MICPNCHKDIPNEAKFCLHCGTKVEVDASTIECQSCHARIPKDSKFCPDCGKSVEVTYGNYNLAVPCVYDYVEDFSEGLALVRKDEKYGFINKSGDIVIPIKYKWAKSFQEGLALVITAIGEKGDGFIDKTGRLVISTPPEGYEFRSSFSEGLAKVYSSNRMGFINKTGNLVFSYDCNDANDFHDGLALVEIVVERYPKLRCSYSFIDNRGKFKFRILRGEVHDFSGGLAELKDIKGHGFINCQGKEVIPCTYDYVMPFSEGLAAVRRKDDLKWGFIDDTNMLVIPFRFDHAYRFTNGLCRVQINGKEYLIDKNGKTKSNDYYFITAPVEGLSLFSNDENEGKIGFIDQEENVTIPCVYEEAHIFNEGLAAVKLNGKWGFIRRIVY